MCDAANAFGGILEARAKAVLAAITKSGDAAAIKQAQEDVEFYAHELDELEGAERTVWALQGTARELGVEI